MKKTLLSFLIGVSLCMGAKAQLTESFDGTTFPPAGWLNLHTTGADAAALWKRAVAGAFVGELVANDVSTGYTLNPHSGAGMALFNSYEFDPGNGAHLITGAVNLSTGGPHRISFWMHRDDTYAAQDSISVYINTTQGATGAFFLGKVLRKRSLPPVESGPNGWYQYTFLIPAGFNSASNYFIFSGVGSFGNNMFIDDISVSSVPTCNVPTGLTVSNFNYGNATLTANWIAPSAGSTVGYEWAINTTGVPPASGTVVAGTTANITGVTPNVVNYVYVRTSCGSGDYSSWVSVSFAALPCVTLITPANNATNLPTAPNFTWQAVSGVTSYDFYLGLSSGSLQKIGTVSGTSLSPLPFDLLPTTTYYWYVLPVLNGVPALNSSCTPSAFTTGMESTTVPNNPCTGAITITSTNTAGNAISSTTVGSSISLNPNFCLGSLDSPDDDVWFEFNTTMLPPVGTLTITPTTTGGITDIVAQVYAATSCTNLGAPIKCIDITSSNASEVIDLSTLTANTNYFMRVYSFGSPVSDRGAFTITASVGNTLPVIINSFTAQRVGVVNLLSWTTEQEINTVHFIVERSSDGVNFVSIGQVVAAGNSNSKRSYSFTDRSPLKGNNYYRLKTVDKDNSSRFSNTRSVRNEGVVDVRLYPNPVTDKVSLAINADRATEGQLLISDMTGKIVYSRSVKLAAGNTTIPINLNNISTGSYIMKIQLEDAVIVRKFSKQ